MSNEIMKVTATEAMSLGKVFFESGMFVDIKSANQAVVKIMAGAEIGLPPLASLSGIHIIQGKPCIGAGLMASSVKASGKYDYKIKEHSEKVCSIDFYQGKEVIGNSTFTVEDAKKAGTKNMDKFPKNMLFARAISNGVRFYTPDIFAGPVYTPEEMNQVTEDTTAEITSPTQPPVATLPDLSPKQMQTLMQRIHDSADTEAGMALLKKAQETFTINDNQAEQLVSAVSGLQIPA